MKPERLSPELVNTLYPVSGVTIFRGAVRVKRLSTLEWKQSQKKKEGQQVTYLSKRSLSNFAFLVSTTEVHFQSLLTLTYGVNFPRDGRKVKYHLTRLLTWLKRSHPGVQYFWFLEFQRRGAPHFHIGLTIEYPGRVAHHELALQWAKISNEFEGVYDELGTYECVDDYIVPARGGSVLDDVAAQHRRQRVWENIRCDRGAIRYVLSYALKPHQKTVPNIYSNVGRFWGASYGVKPGRGADFSATESEVREVMAELGRDVSSFEVLPKYLFHSGDLTQIFSKYIIE